MTVTSSSEAPTPTPTPMTTPTPTPMATPTPMQTRTPTPKYIAQFVGQPSTTQRAPIVFVRASTFKSLLLCSFLLLAHLPPSTLGRSIGAAKIEVAITPSLYSEQLHEDVTQLNALHNVRRTFDSMSSAFGDALVRNVDDDHARRKHDRWETQHPMRHRGRASSSRRQPTFVNSRHNGGCASTEVLCPSSMNGRYARCVPLDRLCDGVRHCPRGEDEHPLNCMYHKATMASLHELKSLVDAAIDPMLQSVQDVWTHQLRTDDRLARAEL